MTGTAPHHFVTVDDAIGDLPRFHWWVRLKVQPTMYSLVCFFIKGRTQVKYEHVKRVIHDLVFHRSSVTIPWQNAGHANLSNTTTSRIPTFNNVVEQSSLSTCSTLLGHMRNKKLNGMCEYCIVRLTSPLTCNATFRVVNIPLDPKADYRSKLSSYYPSRNPRWINFTGLGPDLWEWYVSFPFFKYLCLMPGVGNSQILHQLLPKVASAQVMHSYGNCGTSLCSDHQVYMGDSIRTAGFLRQSRTWTPQRNRAVSSTLTCVGDVLMSI